MDQEQIQKIIDGMTLEQKIGQMFMGNICGGESLDLAKRNFEQFHFGGLQWSGVFERFVRGGNYVPCGVCRNRPLEEDAEFLHNVHRASKDINGLPLIMGGDQEGGLESSIFRRGSISTIPNQMGLGANGNPADVYRAASLSAKEVKALGLDMLYGPSLDINTNPRNPEIGHRSLGEDPETVAALGEQIIKAYDQHNIISTAKHFPGRGHGESNAHHELESIDLDQDRMHAVELLPFKRAIEIGVDSIMVAHTLFPAFEKERIPASFSRSIITSLLREELKFDGLIIPDTLTMFAVSRNFEVPTAAAMCLSAGGDMIFMKVQDLYQPVVDAIKKSVREGRISEDQMNASLHRILTLKAKRGLFVDSTFSKERVKRTVGIPEHVKTAQDLANKCVLVLKNEHILPIAKNQSALAVVPRDANLVLSNDPVLSHDMLLNALKRHYPQSCHTIVDEKPTDEQCFEAVAMAKNADFLVYGIYGGGGAGAKDIASERLTLISSLLELGKPVILILTGAPYPVLSVPEGVKAVIDCFGISPFAFLAAADVIAGKLKPTAKLPVTVSQNMPRGFAL